MYSVIFFVIVILSKVPSAEPAHIDRIDCGVDLEVEVSRGDIESEKYPWFGVLYYYNYDDFGETRAVTPVALVHEEFVIASAADIGPMPKDNFREMSRVLLGEGWEAPGRRVRNYVMHPEYDETYNTLAIIHLKDPVRNRQIRPLCPPPDIIRNPEFYVIKYKGDDYQNLDREVVPVSHVPANMCKDFYVAANLYTKKMRPPHVVCAVSLETEKICVWETGALLVMRDVWGRWQLLYTKKMRPPHVVCAVSLETEKICVWETGALLVMRDVWGRWQLLGLGVRGPGCGAPSRYLDMMSYFPWIEQSLEKFKRLTISKINNQKYVLRSSSHAYQRFGACDAHEKTNLIYREYITLRTDNNQFQFMTYNLTIRQNVEYSCLTLEIVNASAVSEMRVTHINFREPYGEPCYTFRGSRFDISVYLMFADKCSFEMFAWGNATDMTTLDIMEWKWEEGTYYKDFDLEREEYRGPTWMTSFGFEPLDTKMWIPDYEIWTTTEFDNATWSSTTPIPDLDTKGAKIEYGASFKLTTTAPPKGKRRRYAGKPKTVRQKKTLINL